MMEGGGVRVGARERALQRSEHGNGLGEDPGVEAEPARCSAGAPAWRSGVAAAARALLRAEQSWRRR